jgi:hypothetical protein
VSGVRSVAGKGVAVADPAGRFFAPTVDPSRGVLRERDTIPWRKPIALDFPNRFGRSG